MLHGQEQNKQTQAPQRLKHGIHIMCARNMNRKKRYLIKFVEQNRSHYVVNQKYGTPNFFSIFVRTLSSSSLLTKKKSSIHSMILIIPSDEHSEPTTTKNISLTSGSGACISARSPIRVLILFCCCCCWFTARCRWC